MYQRYIKRLLDIIGAILLLPVVFLIIVILGLIIYVEDRGSVFYIAKRRGLQGKVFNMYKLRSMQVNAPDIRNSDNSTYNASDDARVTKIGKIMRKTSLDEVPQIINVLKGDMSFIGPRPVTVDKKLEELDEVRKKRLEVRPGITGYSQAYFRNSISQDIKLKYDAEYVEKISLKNDLIILFKTFSMVFKCEKIYSIQQ